MEHTAIMIIAMKPIFYTCPVTKLNYTVYIIEEVNVMVITYGKGEVNVMVITYGKGKDQPGKVANPARGQLNRETVFFPCPSSRLRI